MGGNNAKDRFPPKAGAFIAASVAMFLVICIASMQINFGLLGRLINVVVMLLIFPGAFLFSWRYAPGDLIKSERVWFSLVWGLILFSITATLVGLSSAFVYVLGGRPIG